MISIISILLFWKSSISHLVQFSKYGNQLNVQRQFLGWICYDIKTKNGIVCSFKKRCAARSYETIQRKKNKWKVTSLSCVIYKN